MRIMTLEGLSSLGQDDDCSRFVSQAQQAIKAASDSAAALVVNAKKDPLRAEEDVKKWKVLRVYLLGVAERLVICGKDDLAKQLRDAVSEVDRAADRAEKGGAPAIPTWAWAAGAGLVSLGLVLFLKRRGTFGDCGCDG